MIYKSIMLYMFLINMQVLLVESILVERKRDGEGGGSFSRCSFNDNSSSNGYAFGDKINEAARTCK